MGSLSFYSLGMNIKLCPGPFFHHFPGSLQHLASCWQSSVLWQCRSKPSKSNKKKANAPPCRPRSSACRPSCKLLRRGTRWRWPGGKTRRSVRTNFCRLSWTKYRCNRLKQRFTGLNLQAQEKLNTHIHVCVYAEGFTAEQDPGKDWATVSPYR